MIEIRSYRAVFDLERRIYRVDQLRLNPGGIPVRGVVYFLAILLATLIAGGLPLVGEAIGALPWYLRDLALPVASATRAERDPHRGPAVSPGGVCAVALRAEPRRLAGVTSLRCAWHALASGGDPDPAGRLRRQMRRLRYTGPGRGADHHRARAHRRAEARRAVCGGEPR